MNIKAFIKTFKFAKDNRPDSDYDAEELASGIEIEKEHTDDEDEAKNIAKDHLDEFTDYYTRLKKMEQEAKQDEASSKEKNKKD